MFGWRGRIGMMIPANNTVIEPEMALLAPEGVTCHATRMVSSRTGTASIEGLHHLVSCVDRAAEELSVPGMDVYVYGCLSTSMAVPGWDREFREKVAKWSDRPAITALEATCTALSAFGLTETAVLCPYGPELQSLAGEAFARWGIHLAAMRSLEVTGLRAVCRVDPGLVYQEARRLAAESAAPALCILATDLTTIPILTQLEEDLKVPVVSTNQALAWAALGLMQVACEPPLGGSLFQHDFIRKK